MKHSLTRLIPFLFLAMNLALMNCSSDSNPMIDLDDPSTLAGNYKLVSVTDKTGEEYGQAGLTITAGEPTIITVQEQGISVTMTLTITGTLTLTEMTYTFSETVTFAISGFPETTETEADNGTYTISGSTMTLVSDDETEAPETGTISVSGSQLTIDFADDFTVVFEKQ